MERTFFPNWQITGCWVVGRLYRFSRENVAIFGASVRGPVRSVWLLGLILKIPIDLWS